MTTAIVAGVGYPVGLHVAQGGANQAVIDGLIDAANEGVHFVGSLWLPKSARGGGGKVLSAAGGGSISVMIGASTITFNDPSSNYRIGVMDMDAATIGHGDGTFDVYADWVGGTDVLTATTQKTAVMEVGSKTLNHADKIAIVVKATARGGSDAVRIRAMGMAATAGAISSLWPAAATESSAGTFGSLTAIPVVTITFDDGTNGFLYGAHTTSTGALSASVILNTGTNPDEVCGIYEFPYPVEIDGAWMYLSLASSLADFDVVCYLDPLGTPTIPTNGSMSFDAAHAGALATLRMMQIPFPDNIVIPANTPFCIAVLPTSATSVTAIYQDFSAASHIDGIPLGTNGSYGARQNGSGPFTQTTTRRAWIGPNIVGGEVGGGAGIAALVGGSLVR